MCSPIPLTPPCVTTPLGFASNLLAGSPSPRQGKKTDNAHPPIHPTKYTSELVVSWVVITKNLLVISLNSLFNSLQQGNDKRLYELVVRHFLACCSKVHVVLSVIRYFCICYIRMCGVLCFPSSQDAEGHETVLDIEISGEQVQYVCILYMVITTYLQYVQCVYMGTIEYVVHTYVRNYMYCIRTLVFSSWVDYHCKELPGCIPL